MRRLAPILATALLALSLTPLSGSAQEPKCLKPPFPEICQKPSPEPSPSPTPSPEPSPEPEPAPSPGPEEPLPPGEGPVAPDPAAGPPGGFPGEAVPGVPGKGSGSTGGGAGGDAPVPIGPNGIQFAFSGPNSSARMVTILSQLTAYGLPLRDSLLEVAGPFPVAGPAWWMDDWHVPRSGGRLHQGLDIFAPYGTPLVAVADGVVSQKGTGGLPGLYVEITDAEGIEYFYCHLSGWAEGIEIGSPVKMGQVLGFVGNSGNAINTPPHVHFEYQPGGTPQPPKPQVDRWVKLAEDRALALLQREQDRLASIDLRLTRGFDLSGGIGSFTPSPFVDPLGGSIAAMTLEIDWKQELGTDLQPFIAEYQQYVVQEAIDTLLGAEDQGAEPPSGTFDPHGAVPVPSSDGSD